MADRLFDPGVPDGVNATRDNPISLDGRPDRGRRYNIPARTGRAVRMRSGERLTIRNPSGNQVCDFWAFADPGIREYLSMAHTHAALQSLFPAVGDTLVSNARRSMLVFETDTSPGVHDTVIAACDLARYRDLGVEGYHDNCTDNLRMALNAIGLDAPAIPAPFNIWMHIPLSPDGRTEWGTPLSRPGDQVVLLALMDVVAVMSACPQDLTPVNGIGHEPADLAFEVGT